MQTSCQGNVHIHSCRGRLHSCRQHRGRQRVCKSKGKLHRCEQHRSEESKLQHTEGHQHRAQPQHQQTSCQGNVHIHRCKGRHHSCRQHRGRQRVCKSKGKLHKCEQHRSEESKLQHTEGHRHQPRAWPQHQ